MILLKSTNKNTITINYTIFKNIFGSIIYSKAKLDLLIKKYITMCHEVAKINNICMLLYNTNFIS